MEKLPHIRGRIATLKEFHDIVRALQAMAATQSRAAVPALEAARAHLAMVEDAARAVLGPSDAASADLPPASGPAAIVLVGTEHGFVGALNERIAQHVLEARVAGEIVSVVGRRGAQVAGELGLPSDRYFDMATHVGAIPDLAGRISGELGWAARLRLVHARHRPGRPSQVVLSAVLPVLADGGAAHPRRPLDRPLVQLTEPELLAGLAGELAFARIAAALVEALASENAARLSAMQTADRNIREKLAQLGRDERELRQEEITEELIDIITGAEAVQGGDAQRG